MEQTIEIGDRVFSEKLSYAFGEPAQGDIITFEDPSDPERVLIKRVIATAVRQLTCAMAPYMWTAYASTSRTRRANRATT